MQTLLGSFRSFGVSWLFAGLLAGSAGEAVAWGSVNRDEALKKIASSSLEQRRQGYGWMADVGTMEDIPLLLSALTDDEELIQGVAQQSIWGIWMRANDSVADPLFQTALDLMNQMKLAESEASFDTLLALKPEFAEGWHRRGEMKALGDRWDDAAADFARALELNPYHFGALEGLGQCSMRRGRNLEAVQYFRRALEINPLLESAREYLRRASEAADRERT